jgi:hypothetical protein
VLAKASRRNDEVPPLGKGLRVAAVRLDATILDLTPCPLTALAKSVSFQPPTQQSSTILDLPGFAAAAADLRSQ